MKLKQLRLAEPAVLFGLATEDTDRRLRTVEVAGQWPSAREENELHTAWEEGSWAKRLFPRFSHPLYAVVTFGAEQPMMEKTSEALSLQVTLGELFLYNRDGIVVTGENTKRRVAKARQQSVAWAFLGRDAMHVYAWLKAKQELVASGGGTKADREAFDNNDGYYYVEGISRKQAHDFAARKYIIDVVNLLRLHHDKVIIVDTGYSGSLYWKIWKTWSEGVGFPRGVDCRLYCMSGTPNHDYRINVSRDDEGTRFANLNKFTRLAQVPGAHQKFDHSHIVSLTERIAKPYRNAGWDQHHTPLLTMGGGDEYNHDNGPRSIRDACCFLYEVQRQAKGLTTICPVVKTTWK